MASRAGIGGRHPGLIHYTDVSHNNKEYIVGTITFKDNIVNFVIDKDDYDKIKDKAWHFTSGNYISSSIIDDSKRKELYLHNLIMNRENFPGKGASETVDHINRNGLDNRKENLRVISQSYQNMNQSKRKRNIIFPPLYTLNPDDVPKHIWYVRANGLHGDRFAIEFKTEDILWKSTSSKSVDIHEKLKQAKEKLEEYYKEYPYLNPNNEDNINIYESLKKSYDEIISKI